MIEAFSDVLWLLMQPCYDLTQNWWIALLLFTVIIKIILLPLSLWVQKNSIIMVKLTPELNRIKVKFYGDSEAIGDAQHSLYKEKHYHPMLSLIPLAVQIIVLFGLVEVVRDITTAGYPGTDFMGLIPSEDGGISWISPLLAGLSAVALGLAQNKLNPLQKEQTRFEKNSTNAISIVLSFVLGIFVATGMGFYWIVSNLASILLQIVCNLIINPKKHVDYQDLEESRKDLEVLNSLEADMKRKRFGDPLSKREKADYKRFFKTDNKHIVYCAESSGFYKYFKGSIEWLLENSDTPIHYITNDPNDNIFELAKTQPRIHPYYIGVKKSITLMMKLDADVVVTTQDDLDNYYIKRSYVRKDVHYAYMCHHITSMHMTGLKHSYDHYDSMYCVGPHQVKELRRLEKLNNLPKKELIMAGYPLLDEITYNYESNHANDPQGNPPVILIAPSWQEDCILDSCAEDMLDTLLGNGFRVIVRPHPEYIKRYGARWQALKDKYSSVDENELYFEHDFSSSDSILTSDILVTDWSTINCEFAFATKKPVIHIDTKMKVNNPDYKWLELEPTDITIRSELGCSLDISEVSTIDKVALQMLQNPKKWAWRIDKVLEDFVYNQGTSAEIYGETLLNRMLEIQERKLKEKSE